MKLTRRSGYLLLTPLIFGRLDGSETFPNWDSIWSHRRYMPWLLPVA